MQYNQNTFVKIFLKIGYKEVKHMPEKLTNSLGAIIYADDVLANIAGLCAVQNYGIVGMSAKSAQEGVNMLLGRENVRKGVRVSSTEKGLCIDIFIIAQYGVSLNTVASNLVESVRYAVESMTGINVPDIHVHVEGVRYESTQE